MEKYHLAKQKSYLEKNTNAITFFFYEDVTQ